MIRVNPGSLAALAAQIYPHVGESYGDPGGREHTAVKKAGKLIEAAFAESFSLSDRLEAAHRKRGQQGPNIAMPTFVMPPPGGGGN